MEKSAFTRGRVYMYISTKYMAAETLSGRDSEALFLLKVLSIATRPHRFVVGRLRVVM